MIHLASGYHLHLVFLCTGTDDGFNMLPALLCFHVPSISFIFFGRTSIFNIMELSALFFLTVRHERFRDYLVPHVLLCR
ncbi:uncharacterized protein BDV17DRAFT_133607 [Aspergillus undulatus]|uniref:uncharacterized protein n=1 Tax=Aspergillus undulatus TaxID=1810928 RepID=UPI003CCDF4C0